MLSDILIKLHEKKIEKYVNVIVSSALTEMQILCLYIK